MTDPNKPVLNEWVRESKEIDVREINPETGEVTQSKQKIYTQSKYIDAPKEKMRCSGDKHIFRVLDKNRWIFGCTKCQYSRIIYPGNTHVTILR